MMDFLSQGLNVRLLLFIGIFYFIVIIVYWKKNIKYFNIPQKPQYFLIILVLIHLLFAFEGGDYFHYYDYLKKNEIVVTEAFYQWLAVLVNGNYLLFRFVVWGGALLFFMLTARRFGFDMYKAVFLLYVMFFTIFDYARASLGMAVFFYGLSFWCKPIKNDKILSYIIIAPLIMFISTYLHRSMYLACAISFIAFLPLNKKGLVGGVILYSMSSAFILSTYSTALNEILSMSGDFSEKVARASSLEIGLDRFSLYEVIRRYIEYSTFFISVFLMSFHMFDKKSKSWNNNIIPILRLYKVIIGLMLLSITMIIASENIVLFYRVLFITHIPIVLSLFYSREKGLINVFLFKFLLFLCLFKSLFFYSKFILSGNLPW